MTCRTSLAAAFVLGLSGPVAAQGVTQGLTQGLTEVTFGTNWLAQGEHGGFYQALADGTYQRYGLKVTIVPGGPRVNNRMLMAAGRLDFYMGGSLIQAFAAVEKDIPTIVVAAMFQKDPQVMMAHPGQGFDTFQDLRRSNSLLISKRRIRDVHQWMKAEWGFKDEQVKPYGFSAALHRRPLSVQQGYATSDPLIIERRPGSSPTCSSLRTMGSTPTRRRSRPVARWSTRSPISCSASSRPRPSAGTPTSTATTRRATRSSGATTRR